MATKKVNHAFTEHFTNFNKRKYDSNLFCEKIEVRARDGMNVPMVMVYDERHYTDDSPWVIFTKGIDSTKEDL